LTSFRIYLLNRRESSGQALTQNGGTKEGSGQALTNNAGSESALDLSSADSGLNINFESNPDYLDLCAAFAVFY